MTRAIVILGAAVWSSGEPSPSLLRRSLFGARAAAAFPDAPVFCSGGIGRFAPSEASVMAEILIEALVDPTRIVLDEQSRDTLQNVVAATRFIRERGLEGALICTDGYHQPRVRMLFALMGVDAAPGPHGPGREEPRLHHRLAMGAREVLAYPYDFALGLRRRRSIRQGSDSV
jgi:uncharacterized SAM-binding protein YcdF (DUF218 family)